MIIILFNRFKKKVTCLINKGDCLPSPAKNTYCIMYSFLSLLTFRDRCYNVYVYNHKTIHCLIFVGEI